MNPHAYIKKLVILTHEKFPLSGQGYYVHLLINEWTRQGIEVQEVSDPGRHVAADAALLHVDLTEVPPEYARAMDRYPIALNRQVVDIAKRRISDNLVDRSSEYEGAVIVKTNLNAGGGSEAWLRYRQAGSWVRRAAGWLSWAWPSRILSRGSQRLQPYDYPVFDRLADVPDEVFENPYLVVEKFLPEFDGDHYWLRSTLCCCGQQCHGRYGSRSRVIKSRRIEVIQDPDDTPSAAIDRWRQQTGLDYGKLDYAVHHGTPVLFDVNRTPNYASRNPTPRALARAAHLASGLVALKRGAA